MWCELKWIIKNIIIATEWSNPIAIVLYPWKDELIINYIFDSERSVFFIFCFVGDLCCYVHGASYKATEKLQQPFTATTKGNW